MSQFLHGCLNGIDFSVEYDEGGGDWRYKPGAFIIRVTAESRIDFLVWRKAGINRIAFLLAPLFGRLYGTFSTKPVVTGVPGLDERSNIFATESSQEVAEFFQDVRMSNAIDELFRLGFTRVIRMGSGIRAERPVYFLARFSASEIVEKAVPCLATLGEFHTHSRRSKKGTVESRPQLADWRTQSQQLLTRSRDPVTAVVLAAINPVLAPFAFWYAGGWRCMVLSFAPVLGLAALLGFLPEELKSVAILLWVIFPWKAASVVKMRNRLIGEDPPLKQITESFRFAAQAAMDLSFGIATALGPALLLANMLTQHWDSPVEAIIVLFAGSVLLAFVTEIILGWLLFRLLRPSWALDNPFFDQQRLRWCQSQKKAPSLVLIKESNRSPLLPSWGETRRALLPLLALPLVFYVSNHNSGPAKLHRMEWAVKNVSDGLTTIRSNAEQGDRTKQFNLGLVYQRGIVVPQDICEAVNWWTKAAAQEHPGAQYMLGIAYWSGGCVTQDYRQAVSWFQMSALQGDSSAQNALGHSYMLGLGINKDPSAALNWWRKASRNGNPEACTSLGLAFATGQGTAVDFGEALNWLQKASSQGNDAARSALATLSDLAPEGKTDKWQAISQSESGSAPMFLAFGDGYSKGQLGLPASYVGAAMFYEIAAQMGLREAQYKLGDLYLHGGFGLRKDEPQAFLWHQQAALQGLAAAQNTLGAMYDNGLGIASNPEIAVYWFRRAADQGFPAAQTNLAIMYSASRGVPKDDAESMRLLRMAADKKETKALDLLRQRSH